MSHEETGGLKEKYRQTLLSILTANPRVERIVLFGSRAMGTYSPESDIDIVLYGDELTLTDLAELRAEIDKTTVPHRVDLLLARDIEKPELLEHIERHGVEWWSRK
jgi:predicted nucleotidyltransferase